VVLRILTELVNHFKNVTCIFFSETFAFICICDAVHEFNHICFDIFLYTIENINADIIDELIDRLFVRPVDGYFSTAKQVSYTIREIVTSLFEY